MNHIDAYKTACPHCGKLYTPGAPVIVHIRACAKKHNTPPRRPVTPPDPDKVWRQHIAAGLCAGLSVQDAIKQAHPWLTH